MERERRGDREKGGKREGRKERREEREKGGKRGEEAPKMPKSPRCSREGEIKMEEVKTARKRRGRGTDAKLSSLSHVHYLPTQLQRPLLLGPNLEILSLTFP